MATTRFAPSPTGHLHIGNLRTALLNFLVARQSGGRFILRFDDTDPERCRPEFIDSIKRDLDWLGLHWDALAYQSERTEHYENAMKFLTEKERIYECFETPEELARKRKLQRMAGRPPVYDREALNLTIEERHRLRIDHQSYWRFLLERERTEWRDRIQGTVSIDAASISDPVLRRADGLFLYTLASVVDDIEMGITDIVRGIDHATNTAAQIQIMRALDQPVPDFAHHSLMTGETGEPLAKRKGSYAIRQLRADGIEPTAILSYLAGIGTSGQADTVTDVSALCDGFDISAIGRSPVSVQPAELESANGRVLASLDFDAVAERLNEAGVADAAGAEFWNVVRENISRLEEARQWWLIFQNGTEADVEPSDLAFVTDALAILPDPPFGPNVWSEWTREVAKRSGRRGKALYLPLRKALTGRTDGPAMAEILPLLQKVNAIPDFATNDSRSQQVQRR